MREASMILPTVNPAATAHAGALMLAAFGGYTTNPVEGAWRDPVTGLIHKDTSLRFCAGMEPTAQNAEQLRWIARVVGAQAEQIAVYVQQADGEVEFIEPLATTDRRAA